MTAPSSEQALRLLGGMMIFGMLAIPLYAVQVGEPVRFFTVVSIGALIAGAACFAGGTLGFLFGIPRTLQQDGGAEREEPLPEAARGSQAPVTQYRANTNLEQISDWLTKILVGVGLTQLGEIRDGLKALAEFAGSGIGEAPHGQVFVMATISFFVIVGFLFGYLWTRLFLASAMREADQGLIGRLVSEVRQVSHKVDSTQQRLDELKRQTLQDAEALNLAYRVLNPSHDLPAVPQEELNEAVRKASVPLRVQIFDQAWSNRSQNWRERKDAMERSIPLLRALIAADVKHEYHRNHGQLGYALKDKPQPDLAGAEQELTRAIEIRGPWQQHGWLFYELNRALCRIQADPAMAQGAPSSPEARRLILADLAAAYQAQDLHRIFKSEPVIKRWMQVNQVELSDLRRKELLR